MCDVRRLGFFTNCFEGPPPLVSRKEAPWRKLPLRPAILDRGCVALRCVDLAWIGKLLGTSRFQNKKKRWARGKARERKALVGLFAAFAALETFSTTHNLSGLWHPPASGVHSS